MIAGLESVTGGDLLIDRPADGAAAAPHRSLCDQLAGAAPASVTRDGLRPEHLRVGKAAEGVPAQVVHAEHLGDASILHLSVQGVPELIHAKLAAGQEGVTMGQTVGLVPDVGWALRFDAAGRRVP